MKTKELNMAAYEAPKVEVIEVEVEQGFAGSPYSGGEPPAMESGGNPFQI